MVKQVVRGDIIVDNIIVNQQYPIMNNGQVFIWDTETHTEIPQRAKVAFGMLIDLREKIDNPTQVQIKQKIAAHYDLNENELARLKRYCKKKNFTLISGDQFNLLLLKLASNGVMICGHNIPFDIGAIGYDFEVLPDEGAFRIKICSCGEETIKEEERTHSKLCYSCSIHPTIILKQVKTKKVLMYFETKNYAAIIDTITLGNALLGNGASSLDLMVKRYGMKDKFKAHVDYDKEYGYRMYIYAVNDVELTCMLLCAEYQLYLKHGLKRPFHTLMSEASVGKAYEELAGVPPFKKSHPEIKPFLYSIANAAYYGARSEAHIRKQPVLIRYCDFKSQYPLVNALLNTQQYLLAEYIHVERNIEKAQDLLDKITLEDLNNKELWKQFCILVKIKHNGDILPNKHIEKNITVFGIKKLITGESWYSITDAIASKMYTDKTPKVIDAFFLIPSKRQIVTNKLFLFGDKNFEIDLTKHDFFVRVIDLRDSVKKEKKLLELQLKEKYNEEIEQRIEYLSNLQQALKLISNSTAYGEKVETREIAGMDIAGKYNAMPLGVHITGGARLLLAIAEKLGLERGLTHAFCDTDSFAYALPDGMQKEDFYNRVNECIQFFDKLSPYQSEASIFELEDYNKFENEYVDLYAYCVSTKRYVLFNIVDGKPRIRKFTEHGITNYNFDRNINFPSDVLQPLSKYWRRERYMMWYRGLELILKNELPFIPQNESWSIQKCYKQTTISTPNIYNPLKHLTIRPFSFFVVTPHSKIKRNKQRFYFPIVENEEQLKQYIKHGKIRNLETNESSFSPYFEMLYERYNDFFNNKEKKFSNGTEQGIMKRIEISVNETESRLRSGKKIKSLSITQLELF